MAKILEMPKLSPTMEEGVLSVWHKKAGDAVEVDDLLAEVETDKATMEFRAFDKGTLLKLLVEAGANVKLGQPVAIMGNAGEDVESLAPAAADAAPKPNEAKEAVPKDAQEAAPNGENPKGEPPPNEEKAAAAPAPKPAANAAPKTPAPKGDPLSRTERDAPNARASGDGRVLASPYIRKVARDRGLDLQGATGSGPGGRLVASDLDHLGAAPANAQAANAPADGSRAVVVADNGGARALSRTGLAEPEVRPLSMMRKTIAKRLVQSKQTVPHFYLTIDVRVDALVAMRESINVELAKGAGHGGEPPAKISINDFLIKACAAALVRVPECNAQFSPEAILVHRRVDISVAVAIPDGLVTPVVRNADQKSITAIGREVRDLAGRARAKKLKPEEMSDGTFSISNLGMFGIDSFSAVINPPEGAILAIGQTRDVPVVEGGAVIPGKMLAMTLSCDHRVIDGAVGASFLAELRGLLEHPMRILTG